MLDRYGVQWQHTRTVSGENLVLSVVGMGLVTPYCDTKSVSSVLLHRRDPEVILCFDPRFPSSLLVG